MLVEGGGHGAAARDPVRINTLIRRVRRRGRASAAPRRRTWTRAARPAEAGAVPVVADRARSRPPRRRDRRRAAQAASRPGGRLAGPAPGDGSARAGAERVHPASRWLSNESAHVESEAGEHDLHAFQAIRRMDEILVAQLHGLRRGRGAEHYDLVVGDEAWDVDYFLHENPELEAVRVRVDDRLRRLAADAGRRDAEVALTADYNAEMIEQRARFARVRDRSVFVGNADDVVDDTFGPGLPEHPVVDRGELRLRRLRHRALGRRRTPTARDCAPSSGTATTSRCAW